MPTPQFTVVRKLPLQVQVVSYPVKVYGAEGESGRVSYEVRERGVMVQRFLWIDHGTAAEVMAVCWAEGFVTGLLKGVRS